MKILKANYLEDYKLEIYFSDGEIKIADFEFFVKNSKHPSINKFSDTQKFKKVKVDSGFLTWNNGEMELSAGSVYNDFSLAIC